MWVVFLLLFCLNSYNGFFEPWAQYRNPFFFFFCHPLKRTAGFSSYLKALLWSDPSLATLLQFHLSQLFSDELVPHSHETCSHMGFLFCFFPTAWSSLLRLWPALLHYLLEPWAQCHLCSWASSCPSPIKPEPFLSVTSFPVLGCIFTVLWCTVLWLLAFSPKIVI